LIAYGWHTAEQTNPCIIGVSSAYLQTQQDPYNNLLRATTQSMSAILGGCQFVEALPYDAYTGNSSDHAYRMGRNILQLLVEEGKINEAVQAADGAYYIESLTAQVAEKSWSCFQELDALPLSDALSRLQGLSSKWTESIQEQIERGEKVIVGVNRYADKSAELLEAKIPLRTTKP
jgi:methylmalonyl-CoA mutase